MAAGIGNKTFIYISRKKEIVSTLYTQDMVTLCGPSCGERLAPVCGCVEWAAEVATEECASGFKRGLPVS